MTSFCIGLFRHTVHDMMLLLFRHLKADGAVASQACLLGSELKHSPAHAASATLRNSQTRVSVGRNSGMQVVPRLTLCRINAEQPRNGFWR